MADGGIALALRRVSKSYGQAPDAIPVLLDFSLEVPKGAFISLFGPNGCGKSTLLHLIAGILEPDAGSIELDATRIGSVGMVFQNYEKSLMPWRTCLDNIALPLEKDGNISRAERRKRAADVVKSLGLSLPLTVFPYQLSGGQKQLTCVARAMVTNPSLLLLDEPFASLDYQTRMSMQHILENVWNRTGVTTVFVSHEIDEAIFLADRLLLLSNRPAQIVESFTVPFPRPRNIGTFALPEFASLRGKVLKRFSEEIGV